MKTQISALDAFLASDIEVTEEVDIPRLNTKLTLKSISTEAFKSISMEVTDKKGRVDTTALFASFIAESEETGLFRNADLLAKVDASSPRECVEKTLLVGELMSLGQVVQDLSGFNSDSQITKAKN